jgi:predicted helicase
MGLLPEKRLNINAAFIDSLTKKLSFIPDEFDLFCYIYCIAYSPGYRNRYSEFLKIDFPRFPLTSSAALFKQLARHGKELINLHLLRSEKLSTVITQFDGGEDRTIDSGHPKYKNGKVIINKQGDGFTGVPEEVWNFYVGGYQVCHKWLKDRKERTLSDDDILHYQRIVVALKETITLMQKIDEAIPSWPIE